MYNQACVSEIIKKPKDVGMYIHIFAYRQKALNKFSMEQKQYTFWASLSNTDFHVAFVQ